MTENQQAKGLDGLAGRLAAIQTLSIITIDFGAICFAFGFPTIILTSPNSTYPFSSGSGLYSGILAILAGVFVLVFLKEARSPVSNTKLKCWNITTRVFLSIGLDVGAVHFAYGIWSLVVCSRGVTEATCGGVNWSANYLLAAVNMTIGLIILVVCLVNYVLIWKVWGVTWKMAKIESLETSEKA